MAIPPKSLQLLGFLALTSMNNSYSVDGHGFESELYLPGILITIIVSLLVYCFGYFTIKEECILTKHLLAIVYGLVALIAGLTITSVYVLITA